jgi:crossover junction endodeoxyribonuclease RusA
MKITLTVFGTPEAQGSKRAFVVPGKGGGKPRAVVVDNAKVELKTWRQEITRTAIQMTGGPHEPDKLPFPAGVPVLVYMHFYLDRPPSVKRELPAVKPDWDKLARAVGDALIGVVYGDDCQVVRAKVAKDYGSPSRVEITVQGWPVGLFS